MDLTRWVVETEEATRDNGHRILLVVDTGDMQMGVDVVGEILVSNLLTDEYVSVCLEILMTM